jgi:adenine deaminase
MNSFKISGQLVRIEDRTIQAATLTVENGILVSIEPIDPAVPVTPGFIMPGFVDSHVHVESSMLIPSEFARLAVVHGTVATISDPHEIANVCGMEGVYFMINNGKTVPFKFHFGAPSCVPATAFETAGAHLGPADVQQLLESPDIWYLSEMMNFPGVLNGDPEVMQKIASAHALGKPVDGHAPGLRGEAARQYISAGISTDHECFTADEALDKLKYGMKILIREGSAARNFEALAPLIDAHYANMMFCSDDKHPDSLAIGHINQLCARAVAKEIDVYKVLQMACINPVRHYNMNVGTLRVGDPADFIVTEDLQQFNITHTYIRGELVAAQGRSLIASVPATAINQFDCREKSAHDFTVPFRGETEIPVIEALDGQLITNRIPMQPLVRNNEIVSDLSRDMLKIVVVNRYHDAPVATAFIKNIGINGGALASSVAHDSHNIVAVGVDDASLCRAVNLVIQAKGGVSAVMGDTEKIVALPVAGLMSPDDGYAVADAYTAIDRFTKVEMGSPLGAPFMTLSFMALLVIPHLKLSDKGLFDGDRFAFVD